MILWNLDVGFVLQASPVAGGAYPPFFHDLIYGARRSRFYPTDTDEQLYEHLQQLDLQPPLQSYPTPPCTGLTFTGHQSTTCAVPGIGSNLLSPHLGQTLMLGSLESGLSARHRRCSSPSSFLHMIREDVSDCVSGDDLWPEVIDHQLRKTSLGLDDSSPVGEWSRKTSSTSGYSEMTEGLRKFSTASEEERLSTYSCSSRKASGASEEEQEQEQVERFLKGLNRVSRSRGCRSADEGVAMLGEDVIQCGTDEGDDGEKLVQMESIPAFQLVIHKADSEDSQNASSLQELE